MKYELEEMVAQACNELFGIDVTVELTRPDEQFGDYSTNVAMQLAKMLKISPRGLSEKLVNKLREHLVNEVDSVNVAGPGFINLRLSDSALYTALAKKPVMLFSSSCFLANKQLLLALTILECQKCVKSDDAAQLEQYQPHPMDAHRQRAR